MGKAAISLDVITANFAPFFQLTNYISTINASIIDEYEPLEPGSLRLSIVQPHQHKPSFLARFLSGWGTKMGKLLATDGKCTLNQEHRNR